MKACFSEEIGESKHGNDLKGIVETNVSKKNIVLNCPRNHRSININSFSNFQLRRHFWQNATASTDVIYATDGQINIARLVATCRRHARWCMM